MALTETTLAADLPANPPAPGSDPKAAPHTVLQLVAALSDVRVEPEFVVQVDEEFMLVEKRADRTNPQVNRARFGSARVAHSSGANVTPVQLVVQTDAPTAPPPATAGAAQQVSLLGPFSISHSTPGIYGGSPTVFLADLDPGSVIVLTWAVFSVAFNGVNDKLDLNICPDGDLDAPQGFSVIDAAGAGDFGVVPDLIKPAIAVAGDVLSCFIEADDPPAFGAADIYALIATPA